MPQNSCGFEDCGTSWRIFASLPHDRGRKRGKWRKWRKWGGIAATIHWQKTCYQILDGIEGIKTRPKASSGHTDEPAGSSLEIQVATHNRVVVSIFWPKVHILTEPPWCFLRLWTFRSWSWPLVSTRFWLSFSALLASKPRPSWQEGLTQPSSTHLRNPSWFTSVRFKPCYLGVGQHDHPRKLDLDGQPSGCRHTSRPSLPAASIFLLQLLFGFHHLAFATGQRGQKDAPKGHVYQGLPVPEGSNTW